MKRLQIFKPGKHTAMNNVTLDFSEADLQATIAAYDPAKNPAPIVIGHPKTDDPAYGWVKTLAFADGVLEAEPDQVEAQFAEMVNAGRFKRISASFYLPDAPNNPAPGVYYLRHVGFLGAQAPAVKGLKSASFAAGEEGVVEFGDWNDRTIARLFRSLKNVLITALGQDKAEAALPEWDLESVTADALSTETDSDMSPAMYSEHTEEEGTMDPKALAAKAAELTQKEASFAEREQTLAKKEAAARHTENLAFAESLVKEGKLLPAQKSVAVAILDFAGNTNATDVVEFGEGDGKKTQPVAEAFKEFLTNQPKIVEFREVAGESDEDDTTASFAAAPGYTVDAAGLELHNKALAYQGKNPGIGYLTAVKAVQ